MTELKRVIKSCLVHSENLKSFKDRFHDTYAATCRKVKDSPSIKKIDKLSDTMYEVTYSFITR